MKKLSALMLAVFAASLLLGSCAKKTVAAGDRSLELVQEHGKFVLGLDDSFPPLGFRDENNEITGYDIDLAREVARRLGVELVCQPIDWSAKETIKFIVQLIAAIASAALTALGAASCMRL